MFSDSNPDALFECRMCGDCCRGYGGTYVSESDIQAIADYLQLDPEYFKTQYCRLSGSRLIIAQSENGYCIFWDKLCRIHPVKPRMCRNWPFIAAVLEDVANWRSMASSCPGMRTDLTDEAICRAVAHHIETRRGKRCRLPNDRDKTNA